MPDHDAESTLVAWLNSLTFLQACLWALVLNVVTFALSLLVGHLLVWRYRDRRVTEAPRPLAAAEVWLSVGCVLLNTAVAIAGYWLWKRGVIVLRDELSWRTALDVVVLLVAMDFLMYCFHRAAHHKWLYPILHSTHHRYDNPRPLNLFVLNPFEVLGFGTLWLIVISLYSCTWIGMMAYLAANLAFGTIGHLGVEPYPAFLRKMPILRSLGSSTFHADHHQNGRVNFGFYTNWWDRLFGTMRPAAGARPA